MSEMNTKEVLLKAAETLETCGWTQHYYKDGNNCFCLVGACREAARKITGDETIGAFEIESGPTASALKKALGVDDIWDVVRWNDVEGRLKSEVVDVLRRAAELT